MDYNGVHLNIIDYTRPQRQILPRFDFSYRLHHEWLLKNHAKYRDGYDYQTIKNLARLIANRKKPRQNDHMHAIADTLVRPVCVRPMTK